MIKVAAARIVSTSASFDFMFPHFELLKSKDINSQGSIMSRGGLFGRIESLKTNLSIIIAGRTWND